MMPFLWSGWGGSQFSSIVRGLSALTLRLDTAPGTVCVGGGGGERDPGT